MAKQTVNIGAAANDGTGDALRTAFDKINDNFNELYAVTGAGSGQNIAISGNSVISENSNGNIILDPNGTGIVRLAAEVRMDVTTQSTVGAAGGASALPASPDLYLTLNINGTNYVVPAFAVS